MEYEIKCGNRTRTLNIEIVPYAAHKLHSKVETRKSELLDLSQDEGIINQRILELRREKAQGWFKEVRELRRELKEIGQEAMKAVDDLFFTSRYELVKLILEKNGIMGEDQLLNRKFWEEDTDVTVLNTFLEACINKDKKKAEPTKA